MYLDARQGIDAIETIMAAEAGESASETDAILPVILCGGFGTGLWPVSRTCSPKQCLPLMDGLASTSQSTLRRLGAAPLFGRATVVALAEARFAVTEQIAASGATADILLEPLPGGFCAAIAVAACRAASLRQDTMLPRIERVYAEAIAGARVPVAPQTSSPQEAGR